MSKKCYNMINITVTILYYTVTAVTVVLRGETTYTVLS